MLLSVVIANYNYGRFLDEAIQSVLVQIGEGKNQVPPGEVEIIIIDGGSTDNSVDVIKKYAGDLPPSPLSSTNYQLSSPVSYWVSEPDKGQSDAFNKGFAKAKGRFLTWLNADDVMLPGTIAKLRVAAEKHPECEWFVGGCFWLDPEMKVIRCFRARKFSEVRFRTGQVSSWGPSSFFTKRLLDRVGGVDVRCKYTMDGDLWLKFAAIVGARYLPFADYVWGLRLHPEAKMSAHNFAESGQSDPNHPKWKQIRYESEIRKEYFTPLLPRSKWNWLRSIKVWSVLLGRLDTRRFAGRYYRECVR